MPDINVEVNILEYGDYAILQNIKNDINLMLQEGSENVSKILLYKKISKVFMKRYIMEFFVFGAVTKGVTLTNSLTRFTANILGSVPLNDPVTRCLMIHFLAILAGWRECYPKLGYTASDWPSEHIFAWEQAESMHFYKKILEYPVPIAVKATCNYLRAVAGHDDRIHHAKNFITWRFLFNHIISDGTIDNLVKIQSVITEYMKKYSLNHIYICWFIHACTSKYKLSPKHIKEVYSFILPNVYPQEFYVRVLIETKQEFQKCLSVLKEKKTLFCSENDPKSMEKYNGLMSYIEHLCSNIA